MTTLTRTPKICKRTLRPVHGYSRWVGGEPTATQLERGNALLMIVADGKVPQVYTVKRLPDSEGRTVGYRLAKVAAKIDEQPYDIDITIEPWSCDCPDATWNNARLNGCKHVCGLRAALKAAGLLK
jgi:hypothetical protein